MNSRSHRSTTSVDRSSVGFTFQVLESGHESLNIIRNNGDLGTRCVNDRVVSGVFGKLFEIPAADVVGSAARLLDLGVNVGSRRHHMRQRARTYTRLAG